MILLKLWRSEASSCFATCEESGIYHFYHWQSFCFTYNKKKIIGETGFNLTFQKWLQNWS